MLRIPVSTVPRGHLQDDLMMCLAGGSGLEQAIAEADAAMPREGLPVASERAGGKSSSERKHWTKFCSARQSIPPTRVAKSQSQRRTHGY
jgi:hypothetical protein